MLELESKTRSKKEENHPEITVTLEDGREAP